MPVSVLEIVLMLLSAHEGEILRSMLVHSLNPESSRDRDGRITCSDPEFSTFRAQYEENHMSARISGASAPGLHGNEEEQSRSSVCFESTLVLRKETSAELLRDLSSEHFGCKT